MRNMDGHKDEFSLVYYDSPTPSSMGGPRRMVDSIVSGMGMDRNVTAQHRKELWMAQY